MNNDRKLLKQALNLLESEWPEGDEIAQPVIDAIRKALADHVEQSLTMVADQSGDANEMVAEHKCGGCARTAADGWALYCVECWEKAEPVSNERLLEAAGYTKKAEPVKQEPVACPNLQPVINWLENGCDPKEAAKELRIYQERMNAAPVDAKAIRAEALEDAAKWFEGYDNQAWFELTQEEAAAAIRGLK